jgi:DNA-binding transcriptional LysR family regulator
MREVNLAGVDLNLLPPLEALLRRRNVSRAAAEVGLSQPAMSRALARLRETLDDPLLVRSANGYALSPRAEALAARLGPALEEVKAVWQAPVFDPRTVERTIRIAGADTHAILLAPPLMARLAREAPGIDIRIVGYSADLTRRMEAGEIDMAFALSTTPLPPGARSEVVGHDRLALVLRRGHPLEKRKWTIQDYARVSHVGVSIFGDAASDLDAVLARAGVDRRIALTTPHFTAALAAVSETDMATTISRQFAERFAEPFGLILKEPPFTETALDLALIWTHVRATDPVLAWLRGVIREVVSSSGARPKTKEAARRPPLRKSS